MFPPEPTKDPYQLLGNVWASLCRASSDHWGQQATVVPADDGHGYSATLQTISGITDDAWTHAAKFIKAYAKASHWTVTALSRKRGYVEMRIAYAAPTPRPERHRESQKTA